MMPTRSQARVAQNSKAARVVSLKAAATELLSEGPRVVGSGGLVRSPMLWEGVVEAEERAKKINFNRCCDDSQE